VVAYLQPRNEPRPLCSARGGEAVDARYIWSGSLGGRGFISLLLPRQRPNRARRPRKIQVKRYALRRLCGPIGALVQPTRPSCRWTPSFPSRVECNPARSWQVRGPMVTTLTPNAAELHLDFYNLARNPRSDLDYKVNCSGTLSTREVTDVTVRMSERARRRHPSRNRNADPPKMLRGSGGHRLLQNSGTSTHLPRHSALSHEGTPRSRGRIRVHTDTATHHRSELRIGRNPCPFRGRCRAWRQQPGAVGAGCHETQ